MSAFDCHLCYMNRGFNTFSKFFRHITIYHQNDPSFHITCNLKPRCGVLYRTYAAYKAHVYRHHSYELHSSEISNCNVDHIVLDNYQQEHDDFNDDSNAIYGDDSDEDASYYVDNHSILDLSAMEPEIYSNRTATSLSSHLNQNKKPVNMLDIKRSYTSFILQLREEFYLPKIAINSISCYIITLINHLESVFEEKTNTSSYTNTSTISTESYTTKSIEINVLKEVMQHLCKEIEAITKNEYQFIKSCEQFYKYIAPEEIILSGKDEELERAYFIPIDRTLSLMFHSQSILTEILQHVEKQRVAAHNDDDLLLSYRDGVYGNRIDDDSLLIQLYIDDIGVTNPIGPKKDQHKLSMIYFSIEDVPEQYRSRLDFINLVGICYSKVLKVKHFI